MRIAVAIGVAAVLGILAERYRVPGGAIVGAVVGSGLVSLTGQTAVAVPRPLVLAALVVIGASIGGDINMSTLGQLRGLILPAVLSSVLLIAAGLAIAALLRTAGAAIPAPVLSTSPGGLSALAGVASEMQGAGVAVVFFHVVRLIMVIATLPLISHWVR